jgi:serine protease Do
VARVEAGGSGRGRQRRVVPADVVRTRAHRLGGEARIRGVLHEFACASGSSGAEPVLVAAASMFRFTALALVPMLVAFSWVNAWAQPASSFAPESRPAPAVLTATAEAVYRAAQPRLLQIRTLVDGTGQQASIGSGFVVTAEGLTVTNYHVVSQHALEPQTYRMEYAAPDGSSGPVRLLAIDVLNDLAVVQLDKGGWPFFEFNPRALSGEMPKGERIYSMGNPLDLGFTIVEGTYNALVERSYNERIHFSGSINAGMSGGPAVTVDGRIVGINVAKELSGEQVSYLVPAKFAAALLERARKDSPLDSANTRREIGRQLGQWQEGLHRALADKGMRSTTLGPYVATESAAPWFTCWSDTNADEIPKPRALSRSTSCRMQSWMFVSGEVTTGNLTFNNVYVHTDELHPLQFSSYLSGYLGSPWVSTGRESKRHTRERCHEQFVDPGEDGDRPVVRAVWCARAYREFEGLFDVSFVAVTQDRSTEALVTRLSITGVSYDNALALARRLLGGIAWAK